MDIAIVDFECTRLESDQSVILCAGFKPYRPSYIKEDTHETAPYVLELPGPRKKLLKRQWPKDVLRIDEFLVQQIRDEIEKYDIIVTWYGKMFDMPMLYDRLLLNLQRPIHRPLHIDAIYFARQGQSKLTHSGLDWVAKALGCTHEKTKLDLEKWKRAGVEAQMKFRDGRENYDYVVEHGRVDVLITEWVYRKLKHRVRNIHV